MKRATVRFKKTCRLALARYVFSKPPLLFIFLLLHTVLPTPPGARAAINNAAAGAPTGRVRHWRRSGRRSNHLSKQTHKWVTNMRVNPQPFGNSICSNMQFFSFCIMPFLRPISSMKAPFALHITNQRNIRIQVSSYWIRKMGCLFVWLGEIAQGPKTWGSIYSHMGTQFVQICSSFIVLCHCCSLFQAWKPLCNTYN